MRQNYLYFEGREGLREMSRPEEAEMCILCRLAHVMEQKLEITFRQRTDKGGVFVESLSTCASARSVV